MRHHTKDKGDLGVGFVTADLLQSGVQPAFLISEHLPFDLIAVSPDNELRTLSVKYRALKDGVVTVSFRSTRSDRHGTHSVKHAHNLYDALAIYCPDNRQVYYVRMNEIDTSVGSLTLRVDRTRNNQANRVRPAEEYLGALRLFMPPSGRNPAAVF